MEEQEEDYIKHIKQVLDAHEEPYVEGAWERFAVIRPVQPKPVISIWKWIAAAAAIIAGIAIGMQYFSGKAPVPSNLANKPLPVTEKVVPHADTMIYNRDSAAAGVLALHPGNETSGTVTKTIHDIFNTATTPDSHAIDVAPETAGKNRILTPPAKTGEAPVADIAVKPAGNEQPVHEFLKPKIVPQENDKNTVPRQGPAVAVTDQNKVNTDPSHSRKWKSSLYVSPIFGSGGVTMGYGYQLGYAINDRLSISSGIAHAKVASNHDYAVATPAPSNSFALSNDANNFSKESVAAPLVATNLQAVQGSLSGIDVPFELNYNITKKIYAGTGVSGLFVLNDNRKYTYVNSSNEKIVLESNKGVIKENSSYTQRNVSSFEEPITNTAKGSTNFMGFYNFSLGYRQKLTRKNTVAVEPFLKIPLTTASDKNLNYTGGGVRLRVDF